MTFLLLFPVLWYEAGVDGYFYNMRYALGGPTPQQRKRVRQDLTALHETSDSEVRKYIRSKFKPSLFEKQGMKKVENHTVAIDLKRLKEEIWKNLEKKSIRWGIKNA